MPSRNFFVSAGTKADQNEWVSVLQWKVVRNHISLLELFYLFVFQACVSSLNFKIFHTLEIIPVANSP